MILYYLYSFVNIFVDEENDKSMLSAEGQIFVGIISNDKEDGSTNP